MRVAVLLLAVLTILLVPGTGKAVLVLAALGLLLGLVALGLYVLGAGVRVLTRRR